MPKTSRPKASNVKNEKSFLEIADEVIRENKELLDELQKM